MANLWGEEKNGKFSDAPFAGVAKFADSSPPKGKSHRQGAADRRIFPERKFLSKGCDETLHKWAQSANLFILCRAQTRFAEGNCFVGVEPFCLLFGRQKVRTEATKPSIQQLSIKSDKQIASYTEIRQAVLMQKKSEVLYCCGLQTLTLNYDGQKTLPLVQEEELYQISIYQ